MSCDDIRKLMGAYFDRELEPELPEALTAHVFACQYCRKELEAIRSLTADLAAPSIIAPPTEELWRAIETRLDGEKLPREKDSVHWLNRMPFRAAALIALAVGIGALIMIWADKSVSKAEASPINFGVILDTLPTDAEGAFREFLGLYDAREVSPAEAKRSAPNLNFGLPEELSGGFRLHATFAMKFGESPGIVARYERQGEFLVAIFHATVFEEDYGTHKDYPCVVGKHRGQRIKVGDWSLVHVTDSTTCHCVLSRLDEATELPDVLSAVAPGSIGNAEHHHDGAGH